MKNALILHDSDLIKSRRKREENWYKWLADQLEEKDYKVFLHEMPLSWKPNIDLYWDFIKEKFNFNNDSVLVGHGTGAAALLGILEKIPQVKSVNKVILVAPFAKSSNENYQALFKKEFDWNNIKGKAKEFVVLYSDNDEVVDVERSKVVAENLGANQKEFKGREHFEQDELLELLDIMF